MFVTGFDGGYCRASILDPDVVNARSHGQKVSDTHKNEPSKKIDLQFSFLNRKADFTYPSISAFPSSKEKYVSIIIMALYKIGVV